MTQRPGLGSVAPPPTDRAGRLSALFDAHADRLYRLARRLVATRDDALDLVQETFLKVARSATSIPFGAQDEEAWLVRMLVNLRRDQWRREAVRRRHAQDLVDLASPGADTERTLVARASVWQALDSLSPRRRAIVVMADIEELPVRSIALLLGITAVTVRWHLSRGRRELARRLRPQAGEVDERENPAAGRRPAPSRTPAP